MISQAVTIQFNHPRCQGFFISQIGTTIRNADQSPLLIIHLNMALYFDILNITTTAAVVFIPHPIVDIEPINYCIITLLFIPLL